MAATYSPTRGNDRDRARELLGDTNWGDDEDDALRQDSHYDAVLAREGFAMGVSYLALELYAEYAQQPVRISSAGDSFDLSSLLKAWDALAIPARARQSGQAASAGASPLTMVPATFRSVTTTDEFSR